MTRTIDLNGDLGEGAGHDAELMPLLSSANIACGGHAGDEASMRVAVGLARAHGVAAGAHPGFPDRAHFGRREFAVTPAQVRTWVAEQIDRLVAVARAVDVPLRHVKPHGALYNQAARDAGLAEAVAAAVRAADSRLILVGLSGSALPEAGRRAGLRVADEVFADRGYRADGSLVPRGEPGALVGGPGAATRMAGLVRDGRLRSVDGVEVALAADTICLHGDGAEVVATARSLRSALASAGVEVRAMA